MREQKPKLDLAAAVEAARAVEPDTLTVVATKLLTASGLTEAQAHDTVTKVMRMLRGTVATTISRRLDPCKPHRIPKPNDCPRCAFNTALLLASRVAQGHKPADNPPPKSRR